MRIAAHLHGRLELAQLGTVLGVHVACGNIVGSVGECCILTDRTDEGHVRKDTGGERRGCRAFAVVVALEAVRRRGIGNAGLTYAQAELHLAAESVVGIEIVIPGVVGNQVFGIYRTAEPFVGVVVGVGHLHMVDLRSRSHRTERDGIDLLVLLEGIAGELAAHVTQSTRTVGIVAASVRSAGTALDLHRPLVVHTATAENDTAPIARPTAAGRHLGGEDDRLALRAFGPQLAARLYDERCLGLLVALDNRTRSQRQARTVGDIAPAFQQVGTFGKRVVALDLELLTSVADLGPVLEEYLRQIATGRISALAATAVASIATVTVLVVAASCETQRSHQTCCP